MFRLALNKNSKSIFEHSLIANNLMLEKYLNEHKVAIQICRTFQWPKGASANRHNRCTAGSLGTLFRNTSHADLTRTRSSPIPNIHLAFFATSSAMTSASRIRHNFHEDCERAINQQINMELYASYVYLSMAYYMNRDDVALPGLYEYFKKASSEEREHAMKFMEYQNKRGGRIELVAVNPPEKSHWGSPKEAMEAALQLEKDVNQSLLEMHGLASQRTDPHLCDFLETEFLDEQVASIKELGDHLTNLNLVGDGLGVYMFDKHFDKK